MKILTSSNECNDLYRMYNDNVLELLNKNKKYNEMMNFMLEEYNRKFNDYKNKIKIEYPKNYLIQLIVNMIILQDNRNKTNIKFRDVIIDELLLQKTEIKNQTNLAEKINLNSLIMKECYNIQELVDIGKSKGCYRITLFCDEKLIKFYERNGFRVNNVMMKSFLNS